MIEIILKAIFVDPWPFWLGGLLIGLLVPLLYYYFNAALGVSTGYGSLLRLIPPARNLRWIKAEFPLAWDRRVFFLLGIVLGGLLSSLLSGNAGFTAEMGRLTALTSWPLLLTALFFFTGGILLGLGARLAGGCTSGHSIHGIANLHLSSILATLFFLGGGVAAAAVVRGLYQGGAW